MKDRKIILDLLRKIIADLNTIEFASSNKLDDDVKKFINIYIKISVMMLIILSLK